MIQIENLEELREKYVPVASALEQLYGRKTPKRHDGMDELVSCILSQNTNDANRDRGFSALKERYPTWEAVQHAPVEELVDTIRSAGLANQKAPRIQQVLQQIHEQRGEYNIDFLADMDPDEAKQWLQSLPGVGPKTAAIVLCFGYGVAAFPVDTHVHRVAGRLGFLPPKTSAEKAHPIMEAIVPPEDYYPFHLQLIQHGREICKARSPKCDQCPLTEYCDYYAALTAASSD